MHTKAILSILFAVSLLASACGGSNGGSAGLLDDFGAEQSEASDPTSGSIGDSGRVGGSDDFNPACFGVAAENPLVGLDSGLAFLSERDEGLELLDCLGQDSAQINYELAITDSGQTSNISLDLTLERDGESVAQRGTLTADRETISFAFDDTTAQITTPDGIVSEAPSSPESYAFFDVEGLSPIATLALVPGMFTTMVSSIVVLINANLIESPDLWDISSEGDLVRGQIDNVHLDRFQEVPATATIEVLSTHQGAPRQIMMLLTSSEGFTFDFAMTIE